MPTKTTLRAVTPGDRPAPKSVTQAASSGSHRDLLVQLRDRIAETVESPKCPPRDLASLSRRLMEIAKDIEVIDLAEQQEVARSGDIADSKFDSSAV